VKNKESKNRTAMLSSFQLRTLRVMSWRRVVILEVVVAAGVGLKGCDVL